MFEEAPQRLHSKYREGASMSTTSLTRSVVKESFVSSRDATNERKDVAQTQRPRRQLLIPALGTTAALALLTVTAVYSFNTGAASGIRFVYSSPSNTIFVLSVLSGITGLLLGVTIDAAVERLQWMLVVRNQGLSLINFMSLHSSTSFLGLCRLTFGPGLPIASSTRAWSFARLVAIIVVPVLGILIMSTSSRSFTPYRAPIQKYAPAKVSPRELIPYR